MSTEKMYQKIKEHGEKLKTIFNLSPDIDAVELCKKLRILENQAHSWAELLCNGDVSQAEYDVQTDRILMRVDRLLNFSKQQINVFVNGDPRGYALKIYDRDVREKSLDIDRDMGGYGLIAPDYREVQ